MKTSTKLKINTNITLLILNFITVCTALMPSGVFTIQ